MIGGDVTNNQIRGLRDHAGTAGDLLQCAICERALGREIIVDEIQLSEAERRKLEDRWPTPMTARAECERIIRDARDQR